MLQEEDVADAISQTHGMMQKMNIPLNPKRVMGKTVIWQSISTITIRYIWKTRCLKVFQNVQKGMLTQLPEFGQRLYIK